MNNAVAVPRGAAFHVSALETITTRSDYWRVAPRQNRVTADIDAYLGRLRMKSTPSTHAIESRPARAIFISSLFHTPSARMKKFKRLILLAGVAWLAAGCASLPPAPSYVPSPFNDNHGQ
jgi:hypothetical protein